jgi:hypothetical protein
MNTLVRTSLLIQGVFIWPGWGLLVVVLVANSEWLGVVLAVAGWIAWTWILWRLFRSDAEPTRWVWQRRDGVTNQDGPRFSRARMVVLVAVWLIVVALVIALIPQREGLALVVVSLSAMIVFLLLSVRDRR